MVILERPFVSDLMVKTLVENDIPVLKNEMSEQRVSDGRIMSDEEFCNEYNNIGKLYTVSENALGWIYDHIQDKRFLDGISIVKDKSAFRKICRDIYPDFFFKEVNISEMEQLDTNSIVFPCVIKPSVGFLSKGVFVVHNPEEYKKAVESLQHDFAKAGADFPEFVVGKSRFLIEEYICGEEYAVDAYYDENENPVILNIFHHKFMDESDTSDRLYMTNKGLFDQYEEPFTKFLTNLNNTLHLRNFPMHIEFRYDGQKAVPIEINPLRFTGFCLNELQVFISGQHPMLSYLKGRRVTKEEMWRGKEDLTYAFTVLDLPSGCENMVFNEAKFSADFPGVIDVRRVPDKTSSVAATVFLRTETKNIQDFDRIMSLDMRDYMSEHVKCLIIGSGPAGYTAGIYAARADLKPLLIEGMQPGGQLTITNEVENFPGYPQGSSGPVIMDDIRAQALRVGAEMRSGRITAVDFSNRPFHCVLDGQGEIVADTVIVATGATARWLGMPNEQKFRGFGVSTCATCDGNFFRNRTTVVIGGGDTALEDALYLAQLCTKVYIVHRRDQFRGTMALQNAVLATPNIEVLWNTVPVDVIGEQKGFIKKVTGLQVRDVVTQAERTIEVDGVFEAIGVTPVSELFKGQLEMTESGYLITRPGTPFTNVEGVFAAGDVQDPNYRQAIIAAASGAMAGIEASRFLMEHGA